VTVRDLLGDYWFARIVLVLWLVSSFFVLFFLGRIDYIVHHDLYDFGLRFSLEWANPYWVTLRLIYVYLAVPAVLSAVVLGLDFWRKVNSNKRVSRRRRKPESGKVQPLRENSMLISCPSCKRVFGKPLVMLNFDSGKPRLVNVCPYCNAVLGNAVLGSADEESLETMHVAELDKEVTH